MRTPLMMHRCRPLALLLALTLALLLPASTLAAPLPTRAAEMARAVPLSDGWGAFADWTSAWLNDLFIEGMKASATVCWFLEKIAAGITRFLTEHDLWGTLLDSTLGALRTSMPEILRGLLFSNDGAGGLVYFALMMAGVLMVIPNLGSARLVEPTRVIVWTVIVVALFVGSFWGYDLIGLVEEMRSGAVQVVLGAAGEDSDLDELVARPMLADEAALADYAFVLPAAFLHEYFPEERQYDEKHVTFIESPFFTWQMTLQVETEESQRARREQAQTGLAIAGLTLFPGGVLLLFGVVFATLAAAALVLILFFLVSLPLGFFDFGSAILAGIVKQYAYLWAITLLATILPGLLVAAGTLTYPEAGPPSPEQLMAFIPILLVVGLATSYVALMARSAMTDTFGIVSASIRNAVTPLAYVGTAPAAGGVPGLGALQGAAGLAATVGLAAATGGTSAALVAGAGSLLSGTRAGHAAATAAVGLSNGERAHVFARAARSRGLDRIGGVVSTVGSFRRKEERAASARFATQAAHTPRDVPAEEWQAVDAGAFLTTNLPRLKAAETAYQQGKRIEARRELTSAFGSREIADEVLSVYEQRGQKGMEEVRTIVTTTQETALAMTRAGQRVFDTRGQATPAFHQALWGALEASGKVKRRDEASAAFAGRLAGATVRQPVQVWNDPFAARKLARETLAPHTGEVHTGDRAAQVRLHELAERQDWGERELEALFEATREGQAAALAGKGHGVPEIERRLLQHGEFQHTPAPVRKEVARLALLVAEQAQSQRGTVVPAPGSTPSAPPAPPTQPGVPPVPPTPPAPSGVPPASPPPGGRRYHAAQGLGTEEAAGRSSAPTVQHFHASGDPGYRAGDGPAAGDGRSAGEATPHTSPGG